MKAIINADDFGKSHEVNIAIYQCFKKRLINRTTLMVNMPFTDEAVEIAKKGGFFDKVGLHANLIEGEPLTKECKESNLCGSDGMLTGAYHHHLRTRLLVPAAIRKIYAIEIEAQIIKYLGYGFTLMHLDSHQHTHTDHSVINAIIPLIKKYEFTSVRLSRNIPPNSISALIKFYKFIYNNRLSNLKSKSGKRLVLTDYFGSKKDFMEWFSPGKLKKETVEIMVHPIIDNRGIIFDKMDTEYTIYQEEMYDETWLVEHELKLY